MITFIKKAKTPEELLYVKGRWDVSVMYVTRKQYPIEKFFAIISCPECGETISLLNYVIENLTGKVDHTVVCLMTGCSFSSNMNLIDWNEYTRKQHR